MHGKDTEKSDLDLLVDAPQGTTLLDMVELQIELEQKLGVPVDVRTKYELPTTFRYQVLREAEALSFSH